MKSVALAGGAALAALGLWACHDDAAGTPAQAKDFYQVYVDQNNDLQTHSLVLVNAAEFTERIPLGIAATNFAGTFATLSAGTRDGDIVRDMRPHSLYYSQNGAWQKVSLRHEGSRTPVRVSNDQLTGLCSGRPYLLAPELGSATGALLLYALAGPDTYCGTSDDIFRRVSVDASPTTPPSPGVPGYRFLDFRTEQGQLAGLLTLSDSGIRLFDASLTSSMLVTSVRGGFLSPLLSRNRADALIALEDGSIQRVDATGALTELLGPRPDVYYTATSDDTHTYAIEHPFVAGGPHVLHRIARNGLEPAVPLWESSDDVYFVGQTAASIVLATGSSDLKEVKVLPKAADGTQEPQPLTGVGVGPIDVAHPGSPLLFTVGNAAYRLDADGSLQDFTVPSAWLGLQTPVDFASADWPFKWFMQPDPVGAFLIDSFDPVHRHLGGTVRLVDLESGAARAVTQIATEEYVRAFGARGSIGMGLMWDESQFDIFSFDLDDDRLVRHTNGTQTDETEFSY